MYEILHMDELAEPFNGANVHEVELKPPPTPPSLHDTVPLGTLCVPEPESRTFALNVIGFPIAVVAGFGVTEVLVARRVIVKDGVALASFDKGDIPTELTALTL